MGSAFTRIVNVHAGETIVVPKGGRQAGALSGVVTLPPPEVLLEPLPEEELAALEDPLP